VVGTSVAATVVAAVGRRLGDGAAASLGLPALLELDDPVVPASVVTVTQDTTTPALSSTARKGRAAAKRILTGTGITKRDGTPCPAHVGRRSVAVRCRRDSIHYTAVRGVAEAPLSPRASAGPPNRDGTIGHATSASALATLSRR